MSDQPTLPNDSSLIQPDNTQADAGLSSANLASGNSAEDNLRNLDLMLDVPLEVAVELGRAQMQLSDLLALEPGSVVELDRLPGEVIDMYVNRRLVARGEIVVVNDSLAFRITEILAG